MSVCAWILQGMFAVYASFLFVELPGRDYELPDEARFLLLSRLFWHLHPVNQHNCAILFNYMCNDIFAIFTLWWPFSLCSLKECLNYHTLALISHTSKVMLKILQARLQHLATWTTNFQVFKLDLEKPEKPEIKLSTSVGSSKKQASSRKISTSALLTMPEPLTMWITTNCRKFLNR